MRHALLPFVVLLSMLACSSGSSSSAPAAPATIEGTWLLRSIAPDPFPSALIEPWAALNFSKSSRFIFSATHVLGIGDGPRNVIDPALILMDLYGGEGEVTYFWNDLAAPGGIELGWQWRSPTGVFEEWSFDFTLTDPMTIAMSALVTPAGTRLQIGSLDLRRL